MKFHCQPTGSRRQMLAMCCAHVVCLTVLAHGLRLKTVDEHRVGADRLVERERRVGHGVQAKGLGRGTREGQGMEQGMGEGTEQETAEGTGNSAGTGTGTGHAASCVVLSFISLLECAQRSV